MNGLVSDTHSAVWYLEDSPELSSAAARAMDDATDNNQPIYVSAITLVELAYLIDKGRLAEQKLQDLLAALADAASNFELFPVDLAVAQALRKIPRVTVPDMPDRIIAATAVHLGLPLVTRDNKIQAANLTTVW